jgi:hypothetical protein
VDTKEKKDGEDEPFELLHKEKQDTEDEPFDFSGKSLDAEGNLQSRAQPVEVPTPTRSRPSPTEVELEVQPQAPALELEARPPPAETDYVQPPAPLRPSAPSHGLGPWPALLLLAALGTGGWYFFFGRPKPPPSRVPIAVVILITSEPTGAQVTIGGTVLGVTPWAVDNTWSPGPVSVTLTAPGYRPWTGSFQGGRPARLEVRLQRR